MLMLVVNINDNFFYNKLYLFTCLQTKYTAVSIGLVTDRLTLPRRVALSIRQRDQSEINLASEVQKMQQDIQASVKRKKNAILR